MPMRKILITGGAGFIGSNASRYFSRIGDRITILDNLSRAGTKLNLELLFKQYPKIKFIQGDIRDPKIVSDAVRRQDVVMHLAGQVAVTSSIAEPTTDFQINTLGTLNVLEALRKVNPKALIIYSSTNKVYGNLSHLKIKEKSTRYQLAEYPDGIDESQNLDFHSP